MSLEASGADGPVPWEEKVVVRLLRSTGLWPALRWAVVACWWVLVLEAYLARTKLWGWVWSPVATTEVSWAVACDATASIVLWGGDGGPMVAASSAPRSLWRPPCGDGRAWWAFFPVMASASKGGGVLVARPEVVCLVVCSLCLGGVAANGRVIVLQWRHGGAAGCPEPPFSSGEVSAVPWWHCR